MHDTRGDDDDVVALQQRARGGVAHAVDLLVHRRFLLDVGVGARHVGFGLVVVVVGDEVLDRVVGEEALELAVELGRQRLVGRQDQRRALGALDHLRHGEGLARAGDAEQHLVALELRSRPSTSSAMAVGWSPLGSYSDTSLKAMPPSDFSGRGGRCGMNAGRLPDTSGCAAIIGCSASTWRARSERSCGLARMRVERRRHALDAARRRADLAQGGEGGRPLSPSFAGRGLG